MKNHENQTDPYENHENLEFFRIALENQKSYESSRIQFENHENHENR